MKVKIGYSKFGNFSILRPYTDDWEKETNQSFALRYHIHIIKKPNLFERLKGITWHDKEMKIYRKLVDTFPSLKLERTIWSD